MKIFIAAGGSGTKVLESMIHLCAIGLGPAKVQVLVVDPDQANGNRLAASKLLAKYNECRASFRSIAPMEQEHPFFRTQFEVFPVGGGGNPDGGGPTLPAWSPVQPGNKLESVFQFNLLDRTSQDVMNLFFTQEEREEDLDIGFKGHPSIGAAVMALLPDELNLPEDQRREPWRALTEALENPQIHGPGGVDLVIGGSVFGGTGASTFYPLARALRGVPAANPQLLRVHAFLLVPYFGFPPGRAFAANSNRFPLATKAAALFYDHLHTAAGAAVVPVAAAAAAAPGGVGVAAPAVAPLYDRGWPFASTSWLGDTGRLEIGKSDLGGAGQANRPYFVDMLAAWSVLEIFRDPPNGDQSLYCGAHRRDSGGNIVGWADVPTNEPDRRKEFRNKAVSFIRVGAYHAGFVAPVLGRETDARLRDFLPWYRARFGASGLDLRAAPWRAIGEFFSHYHFPWWIQLHETAAGGGGEGRLRLLNHGAFSGSDAPVAVALEQLANLTWREEPNNKLVGHQWADRFHKKVVDAAAAIPVLNQPGPLYLSMLAKASADFEELVKPVSRDN